MTSWSARQTQRMNDVPDHWCSTVHDRAVGLGDAGLVTGVDVARVGNSCIAS